VDWHGLGLWFAIKKKHVNNKTLGTGLARSWSLFKKQKNKVVILKTISLGSGLAQSWSLFKNPIC
jgi:hypothetical protein